MQVSIEDEQRSHSEAREAYAMSERRCMILQGEVEEMRSSIESAERARKSAETELHEANDRVNELAAQVTSLQAQKRKLEGDVQAMQVSYVFGKTYCDLNFTILSVIAWIRSWQILYINLYLQTDLEEMNNEIRAADDKAKKAMAEAGHLAEELRAEQEHSNQIEKFRKGLEHQIKELQVRLDEAEASALKGGKKMIAKLENRVRSSSIKKNRRDLNLNLCIMLVF